MLGDLKVVVDLIRDGFSRYRKFESEKSREDAVLQMLEAYFIFLDCAEEAERLVAESGANPLETIRNMESSQAAAVAKEWGIALHRQAVRLRVLQGLILGQDHLVVVDPELQNKIDKVVGDKMDTSLSLFKIGAHLFFHAMFGPRNPDEEAESILVMVGADEGESFDMGKILADVAALRASLDQYREFVTRFVSNEELLRLSARARKNTTFERGEDHEKVA
jgi:hypothetical protein